MKGNTGKIHMGSEGELYKYINHHAGTPKEARSRKMLSPTHGQRFQKQSGQITPQSVLINKPKFLKAARHAERRKIEIQ